MKLLRQALRSDAFLLDYRFNNLDGLAGDVIETAMRSELMKREQQAAALGALLKHLHESTMTLGNSVALPHVYLPDLETPFLVLVRLKHPLNLGAPDGIATHYFCVLFSRQDAPEEHFESLVQIARFFRDEQFRYELGEGDTQEELLNVLESTRLRLKFGVDATELEAVEEQTADDPLSQSGLFAGLMADVRRRLPYYGQDIRDGLHSKTISSGLFLFFACLAPAVIFGGLWDTTTGGEIGVVEMLLATGFCGVIYACFSGQPLALLGGTGPIYVFVVLLHDLTVEYQIPFLPFYAWTGLWCAALLALFSITNLSNLLRFFTRFTDEIFAALIAVIFIYSAFEKILGVFELHPGDYGVSMFSTLLTVGTYMIAMSLKDFRKGRYLLPVVRELLADFGPSIAMIVMSIVAFIYQDILIDALPAPDTFGTSSGRDWLIPFLDLDSKWIFLSMIPALFLSVLMYLDQNITTRLVNSADYQLQKGPGFHLDMLILAGLMAFCSLLGLPWVVAATVRSLNHIKSLATYDEQTLPNGDTKELIIHVRETRLSGILIHVLMLVSLSVLGLLKVIPMSVLYGLFLFMGVASLSGNQFFERMTLWFMDRNLYPAAHYIRKVPIRRVHLFTAIQMICLATLWFVKSSSLGILFPIFIALLVLIRRYIARFFENEELEYLDAEEHPDEEEDRWN